MDFVITNLQHEGLSIHCCQSCRLRPSGLEGTALYQLNLLMLLNVMECVHPSELGVGAST